MTIDDARLAAIEVIYGKAPPGSVGHSLVELAAEVTRLRRIERVAASLADAPFSVESGVYAEIGSGDNGVAECDRQFALWAELHEALGRQSPPPSTVEGP